jgi:probable HAF family extracellular repeat protein
LSPGQDTDAIAVGINSNETVVGSSFTPSGLHAFVADQAGKRDLGTLPGHKASYARAVNASGQIVGCSSDGGNRRCTAFIYDKGQMTSLGQLPGMTASDALAINDAGVVVGRTYNTTGPGHAFVWTARDGLRDLNQLLSPGSGWVLQAAAAINSSGQIAGTGVIGGRSHAFRLDPSGT